MADLNPIGKRIHNISPDPVRLTLDDGTEAVFRVSGAEFFQQEFQAEGTRDDDDGAAYRFVSSADNDAILVGRKGPDEKGWSMIGEAVEAEPVEAP
ncbi:transcriptional regulator [Natronorubrum sp. A-ect3]|uniref:transcriptional regulator n=1 Tax=Natronorubrum sp. A-ect3 TaxID=3242698 RepID=UPI00359ECA84